MLEEMKLLIEYMGGVQGDVVPIVWFYLGYQVCMSLIKIALVVFVIVFLTNKGVYLLETHRVLGSLRDKLIPSSAGDSYIYHSDMKKIKQHISDL